ncbi:MAG: hypothetical protein U0R80_16315 [Nocardioidaceae bacterium]
MAAEFRPQAASVLEDDAGSPRLRPVVLGVASGLLVVAAGITLGQGVNGMVGVPHQGSSTMFVPAHDGHAGR